MPYPIQVTFRDAVNSESLKEHILDEAERLDHYFDGIQSCRVLFEAAHRHHRKGRLYRVRINLTVAGRELVVGRNPAELHAHKDAYVAVHHAFEESRRQLRDYVMIRRGRVKHHEFRRHRMAVG